MLGGLVANKKKKKLLEQFYEKDRTSILCIIWDLKIVGLAD